MVFTGSRNECFHSYTMQLRIVRSQPEYIACNILTFTLIKQHIVCCCSIISVFSDQCLLFIFPLLNRDFSTLLTHSHTGVQFMLCNIFTLWSFPGFGIIEYCFIHNRYSTESYQTVVIESIQSKYTYPSLGKTCFQPFLLVFCVSMVLKGHSSIAFQFTNSIL